MVTEQKKERARGEISLVGREEMKIGGALEVLSFDDESVRLKCVDGELLVEGSDIKIGALDTERGIVSLRGRIDGMYYADEPKEQKKGFWGRVMR